MDTVDSADLPAVQRKLARGKVGRALVRWHKELYYELDFGRVGGRRLRRYCRTATAAYATAIRISKELREHGQLARCLTTGQRWEAAECLRLLGPTGARLTEVVSEYVKRHPLGGNGRTVKVVIKELIEKKRKGNRRGRYVSDLEGKLGNLEAVVPGRSISAVTTEDLEAEIGRHEWAPGSVHSAVQAWNVLFNYAVKRGYRTDNPCHKLELPKRDKKEPVIFTVEQVRQMMALTETTEELRACRAYAAIGTFAGIRPHEMEQLQWEQVDFANKTITVTGPTAKCRNRRVVDMSPNLFAWLQPIAQQAGPVFTAPLRVLRTALRVALGLGTWPHDVMRHCFGTYHFARWGDERKTTFQMGHGRDTDVFFSHYRALVQPAAGVAFWEIFPAIAVTPAPQLP